MATWAFVLFVVLLVMALASRIPRRSLTARRIDKAFDYPYRARRALLTAAEQRFFDALSHALEGDGIDRCIMSKVRLEDIIVVRRGLSAPARQGARNRIRSRHVDFVICRRHDMAVLGCVELDDRSHDKADRARADEFLDTSLRAAGVALLRVRAAASYDVNALATRVRSLTAVAASAAATGGSAKRGRSGTSRPAVRPTAAAPSPDHAPQPETRSAAEAIAPVCPQCGGPMQQAEGPTGAMAGRAFQICINYPDCRGMRPLSAD